MDGMTGQHLLWLVTNRNSVAHGGFTMAKLLRHFSFSEVGMVMWSKNMIGFSTTVWKHFLIA